MLDAAPPVDLQRCGIFRTAVAKHLKQAQGCDVVFSCRHSDLQTAEADNVKMEEAEKLLGCSLLNLIRTPEGFLLHDFLLRLAKKLAEITAETTEIKMQHDMGLMSAWLDRRRDFAERQVHYVDCVYIEFCTLFLFGGAVVLLCFHILC